MKFLTLLSIKNFFSEHRHSAFQIEIDLISEARQDKDMNDYPPPQLYEFYSHILSNPNENPEEAVTEINEILENPNSIQNHLILIQTYNDATIKCISLVMLQRLIKRHFKIIGDAIQQILEILIEQAQNTTEIKFRNFLCSTITVISERVQDIGIFDEVREFANLLLTNEQTLPSGFDLWSTLAVVTTNRSGNDNFEILWIALNCLNSDNPDIIRSATQFISAFLWADCEYTLPIPSFLPILTEKLDTWLNTNDWRAEYIVRTAISANESPILAESQSLDFPNIACNAFLNTNLTIETRILAMQVVNEYSPIIFDFLGENVNAFLDAIIELAIEILANDRESDLITHFDEFLRDLSIANNTTGLFNHVCEVSKSLIESDDLSEKQTGLYFLTTFVEGSFDDISVSFHEIWELVQAECNIEDDIVLGFIFDFLNEVSIHSTLSKDIQSIFIFCLQYQDNYKSLPTLINCLEACPSNQFDLVFQVLELIETDEIVQPIIFDVISAAISHGDMTNELLYSQIADNIEHLSQTENDIYVPKLISSLSFASPSAFKDNIQDFVDLLFEFVNSSCMSSRISGIISLSSLLDSFPITMQQAPIPDLFKFLLEMQNIPYYKELTLEDEQQIEFNGNLLILIAKYASITHSPIVHELNKRLKITLDPIYKILPYSLKALEIIIHTFDAFKIDLIEFGTTLMYFFKTSIDDKSLFPPFYDVLSKIFVTTQFNPSFVTFLVSNLTGANDILLPFIHAKYIDPKIQKPLYRCLHSYLMYCPIDLELFNGIRGSLETFVLSGQPTTMGLALEFIGDISYQVNMEFHPMLFQFVLEIIRNEKNPFLLDKAVSCLCYLVFKGCSPKEREEVKEIVLEYFSKDEDDLVDLFVTLAFCLEESFPGEFREILKSKFAGFRPKLESPAWVFGGDLVMYARNEFGMDDECKRIACWLLMCDYGALKLWKEQTKRDVSELLSGESEEELLKMVDYCEWKYLTLVRNLRSLTEE